MRLAVIGDPEFKGFKLLKKKLDRLTFPVSETTIILTGGKAAGGTEELARRWAALYWHTLVIHHPYPEKYGKEAPRVRDKELLGDAQAAVFFTRGYEPRVNRLLKEAKAAGLKVVVVKYKDR